MGRSRWNFETVKLKAIFGSRNLSRGRRSTSRVRKKECANFRAVNSDRCWYTKAVNARGIVARASLMVMGSVSEVGGWRASRSARESLHTEAEHALVCSTVARVQHPFLVQPLRMCEGRHRHSSPPSTRVLGGEDTLHGRIPSQKDPAENCLESRDLRLKKALVRLHCASRKREDTKDVCRLDVFRPSSSRYSPDLFDARTSSRLILVVFGGLPKFRGRRKCASWRLH